MPRRREDRYAVARELATRLRLPYDPEEGFVFRIVDDADKAFGRLDADEAWRYLEALAIRVTWWFHGSPPDDRRHDADASRDAEWFWRTASIILCDHVPAPSACEACLGQGRGSLDEEERHDGFTTLRSPFIAGILREVLTPYIAGRMP